jgi:hypothetical protein
LHWDGHGFLEIHPAKKGDVKFAASDALMTNL